MARRKSNGSQELPVVHGVRLKPDQYDEYLRALESRRQSNWQDTPYQQEAIALQDVLFRARASVIAQKRFIHIFNKASSAATAVGSLREFPFYSADVGLREAGNKAVKHLAGRLAAASRELLSLHAAMDRENRRDRRKEQRS